MSKILGSKTLDKGKAAAKWMENNSMNRSEDALRDLLKAYHLLDAIVDRLMEGDENE